MQLTRITTAYHNNLTGQFVLFLNECYNWEKLGVDRGILEDGTSLGPSYIP